MCDLGRSQSQGSLMKAALMLTMEQQNLGSFRVNSGSHRFGQYRQESYVEHSSSECNPVDMGKSGWVNNKRIILGSSCVCAFVYG